MYWNARSNNNRRTVKHSHIDILANCDKKSNFFWTYGESDLNLPDVHRDVLPNLMLWTYGESDPNLPDVHRDVLPNLMLWTYGGIGPQPHPCHGCNTILLYTIFITCSLTIKSSIFLFLHFFNLFSIRLASEKEINNFLKTSFIGIYGFKETVLPELCSLISYQHHDCNLYNIFLFFRFVIYKPKP